MGKSQSKQLTSETKDGNHFRFALVGSSGSGKSAFINAVRGVDEDEDENAMSADIAETEQSPKEYIYPSHPRVSFCDIPGYGTPSYPDLQTCWTKLEMEKFDTFLIFISNSVTALDLNMIQKIKSLNKSYLLIRTKIDVKCGMKNQKLPFTEDELLAKLRDDFVEQTGQLLCAEDIFLISNFEPYKWDFFRLIEAIMKIMPDPEVDTKSDFTKQYMADTRTYTRENGFSRVEEFLKKTLEQWKNSKIRIGITGGSGTGKSEFINTIRGLKDDDDGAAYVDVVETTTLEATEFHHPNNPNISFVYLPSISTPIYPDLNTYCKEIGLEKYDTFLILSVGRFAEDELQLAQRAKLMGKSLFLIRTKIDVDCMYHKRRKPINEAEILGRIRQHCMGRVEDRIPSVKEIFLISNDHADKWDFDRLIEAISDALPVVQRECLTLSLSNVTSGCLKRKAEILRAQAFLVAAISAGTGAIPTPGIASVFDPVLLLDTINTYFRQLGLKNTTPKKLELLDKKYMEIIQRYHMRSAEDIVSLYATKTSETFCVEDISAFIPVVGPVIAKNKSFALTLSLLYSSLNEIEEAALAVWDNAAEESVEDDNSSTTTTGIPVSWQWVERSVMHREMLMKLREKAKNHPEEIQEINGVRVCCSKEFLIDKGSDGTRVYVGLGKDGVEKAVKRLLRDACTGLAQQEKKVLNELGTMKSNHVVNYWFLEEQGDKNYLFLILDLCEETLENFVKRSNLTALVEFAPDIIEQVLKGLVDLHRGTNPILHRDLKPSNILRDVENNWLLADFGISRILTAGVTTHVTRPSGTEDWKAVESCSSKGMTDDDKSGNVRCKKESDIQVAGMVAFYILTKGKHPFGEKPDRLRNLLDGKPVGLDTMEDIAAKDLISWMLSHDPKDRPSAEEALKHPYLQPAKQQFEMLCKVGNQPEIKKEDVKSDVVRKLNSDPKDWRNEIAPDVFKYLSTDYLKGKTFSYKPSWTGCLRLIRNVMQHWHDRPMPQPEVFYIVGKPSEYFLNLFPRLCVDVHKIIRSCDWKERDDLKEYFI